MDSEHPLHEIEKMRADTLFVEEARAHLEKLVAGNPGILNDEPGLRVIASLVNVKFAKSNVLSMAKQEREAEDLVASIRAHLFNTKVPIEHASSKLDYFLVNMAIALTRPKDSNPQWRNEVPDATQLFSPGYLLRYIEVIMARLEQKRGICTKITRAVRRRLCDVKALLVAPELFGEEQLNDRTGGSEVDGEALCRQDFIPPDLSETETVAPEIIERDTPTQPLLHAAGGREPTPGRMRRLASDIGDRFGRLSALVVAFNGPRGRAASDKPEARV